MLTLGIDEAGRGPVIGPLVIAGVLADSNEFKELKRIGVKDSKLLTPQKREDLFDKIISMVKDYKILIINPKEVDNFVFENRLNELELLKFCEIINYFLPDKVIIDAPGNNIKKIEVFIRKNLIKKSVKLVLEHKADLKYEIVGAASILAKVTRDRIIEELKQKYKVNFGSGYMSDPLTQEFLSKNWNNREFQHLFRKSWASWQNLSTKKTQRKLSDFNKQ